MNEIAEKIKALEESRRIDFANLPQNEQFIDIIIQATSLAIKTSEIDKINIIKNAVINTAVNECPDKTQSHIFLNLIDTFTVWHINILILFDNPKKWFVKAGQTPPNLGVRSLLSILKAAYPVLIGQEELVDVIWNDLEDAGFHRSSGLRTTMSGDGALAERTTQLGKEFIQFISEH